MTILDYVTEFCMKGLIGLSLLLRLQFTADFISIYFRNIFYAAYYRSYFQKYFIFIVICFYVSNNTFYNINIQIRVDYI